MHFKVLHSLKGDFLKPSQNNPSLWEQHENLIHRGRNQSISNVRAH